ncbi:hypothetical protein SAMN05660909_05141 [Chitinophaga terrae (ex Kim and Jung 2007)]|uniref:Peptide-N(4)-(N-acetyl-beta-glucosaminyl)asparagine amidase n=1 Tax=Chitinophaga terrae (ex Kim and Jung 2007) TaxID=408074 RepID=A0A1H4GBI7_9BACT|nr:hypothetical protein [Chitinophaga terrae (ex Kim and Jung 2007)]GEP93293.1 hypothetical protein CTE07_49380 [Chitinophaga terrae (ex Kim and Jung 2007)]SEB06969.1 hypothetical protein SAMN05660909_05141 [Chitinophaga terrae (ex Kim and Jung 2007)]
MKTSKLLNTLMAISFILPLLCCQHTPPSDLESVFNNAGNNRKELETVIAYFSKNPADSLKLDAAIFLLKNLEGLKTLDSTSMENTQIYFTALNKYYLNQKSKIDFSAASIVIDSLNRIFIDSNKKQSRPIYLDESATVSADFLIKNIDLAFLAWQSMPWSKHVDFKVFLEYILPYRCTDTYGYNTRQEFYTQYKSIKDSVKGENSPFIAANYVLKDVDSWFTEDGTIFQYYPYLKPITFSNLTKGRIGACIEANSLKIAALRSIGIPVALDEIPNWGNVSSSHYWYKIIDPQNDTITTLITNQNERRYTQHLISGSSYDLYPEFKGLSDSIVRNYIRTVPKVYRRTFEKQSNSLAAINNENNIEMPDYFKSDRIKDVSDQYLNCVNVDIKLDDAPQKSQYAYLCIFNNTSWIPVAWAKVNSNFCTFEKMGKNVVYLPAYFKDKQIIPAGAPFLLKNDGSIERFVSMEKQESVKLRMKYPFRIYVEFWESFMIGGRFQLANKSDLSDTITVHRIDSLPFYQTDVKIPNKDHYRYVIYQFSGIPKMFISEIQVYGEDENGKEVMLPGKVIGNPGRYPKTIDKIRDGDNLSYFENQDNNKETYVGFDLGSRKKVTRISFVPRNDDNAIVAGDMYELFYWDKRWISIDSQKGDSDKTVIFNDVPKQSLLILINKKGGVENRIFTYLGGKQFFW